MVLSNLMPEIPIIPGMELLAIAQLVYFRRKVVNIIFVCVCVSLLLNALNLCSAT